MGPTATNVNAPEKTRSDRSFATKKGRSNSLFFQPKLTVGPPNDLYEQEADAMADKVMRMEDREQMLQPKHAISSVQRTCAECEEKEEHAQRKESGTVQAEAPSIVHDVVNSGRSRKLDGNTRSFMENRFGYDFSNVKIHNDTIAANAAQSVNALAYTRGNSIVFNEGQYKPATLEGKKLLAHELTHVIQQQSSKTASIQRTAHQGTDHAGSYTFDDQACTMRYDQNWYFQFPDTMTDTQRNAYMGRAESEIESTWSHRHRLLPTSGGCACQTNGVDVNVDLHTSAEPRRGRLGYTADVRGDHPRAFTNPVTSTLTLADNDDVPQNFGASQAMPVLAHEFGHTLGITDEYSGWNHFWDFFRLGVGANDKDSLMNLGNEVRPRHYQHFADLISNVLEGCQYQPQGYTSRTLANPVVQTGVGASLSIDNADFILDLSVDRRLGNSDVLGLFTPRIGYRALLNVSNGNMMSGPTASLSLNRLAHPVYLNIGTGLLFDPEDPGRPVTLNIPLSVTAGIRRDGFSAGINYTGLVDVLNNRGYTHMVGLTFTFDR